MTDTTKAGTVLIREGTAFPQAAGFESEPYVRGWRLIKNLDTSGLAHKMREAGWAFSYVAGEINATAVGLDEDKMVRRAVERILANLKTEQFNSLEITRVAPVASKRFPLVTYVTVSARSRHIQEYRRQTANTDSESFLWE